MSKNNHGRIWMSCLNATLGCFLYGFNLGVFNTCQQNVSASLGWGDQKALFIAVFSAFIPIGAFFSSFFAGACANKYGRRKSLMYADVLGIFASLITIIPYTIAFGIGRLLSGLATGIFITVPGLYLSEISPPKMRGKLGSLQVFQIASGLCTAFSFGFVLPTENYNQHPSNYFWMLMYSFWGVVCLFQLIMFIFIFDYETPQWLTSSGRADKASSVYMSLYSSETPEWLTKNEVETVIEETADKSLELKNGFKRRLRLGIMINIAHQITGCNMVASYSNLIFNRLKIDVVVSRILTLCTGLVVLFTVIFYQRMVDTVGRRSLVLISTLGMGAFLIGTGVFIQFWPTEVAPIAACILLYKVSYTPMSASCYIYSGEILNDETFGKAIAVNWFTFSMVVFSCPFLIELLDLPFIFCMYGGFSLILFFYFLWDMVETKGLSKKEIIIMFDDLSKGYSKISERLNK